MIACGWSALLTGPAANVLEAIGSYRKLLIDLDSHVMCIVGGLSLSDPGSQLSHEASGVSHQTEVPSVARASHVTSDDEEVQSQSAVQSHQLTASESGVSQIADLTQDQAELESGGSVASVESSEADSPNLASVAEGGAESAEDDYGDEFEADGATADASYDSPTAGAATQNMYDNPLGSESSESASDMPDEVEPFTPMARASVFTASANLSDNVDIFNKTQPAPKAAAAAAADATTAEGDSDLAPEFGAHLARIRSGLNNESGFESGTALTPSYRRQEGRSLQQAVDNEQPFGTAWRRQALPSPVSEQHIQSVVTAPDAVHVAPGVTEEKDPGSGTGAVNTKSCLAPKPADQVPSRQSSVSVSSGANLSLHDRQPSLQSTAGSLKLSAHAEQPELSTAGTAGGSKAPYKQPSISASTGAFAEGKAAAGAAVGPLSSQNSLVPQFSLGKLASGSLSKQPSYLALPASGGSSRRSSFSARLERETSQVLIPRQSSSVAAQIAAEQPASVVSRTASLGGSVNPLLSPEASGGNLVADAAASGAASMGSSKQLSLGKSADLSHQASQMSRQPSMKAAAAAAAPSEGASRQSSFSKPAGLSRQASQVSRQPSLGSAVAAAAAPRQPSFSRQASLSRQTSQVPQSNSGSPAPAEATSSVLYRKASFSRPASASRQGSQMLQPQLSGGKSPPSRSASNMPSRQASLSASVQSAPLSNAPSVTQQGAAARQAESSHDVLHSGQVSPRDQSVNELTPSSRTQSVSSQPQRTASLEVMHRQMSMTRKAPAVDHDALKPANSLSGKTGGGNAIGIEHTGDCTSAAMIQLCFCPAFVQFNPHQSAAFQVYLMID